MMILGPACWWLILLLVLPSALSAQLAVLIVRDFALMYAVCKPNVDILMLVEHDSSVIMRTCEELRGQFQSLFVRANPEVSKADMLEACERAFVAFDTDGCGTLSRKEFAALIKSLTGDAASKKMLDKLLRLVDVDASGYVCIDEFLHFAAVLDDHDEYDVAELESRVEQLLEAHRARANGGGAAPATVSSGGAQNGGSASGPKGRRNSAGRGALAVYAHPPPLSCRSPPARALKQNVEPTNCFAGTPASAAQAPAETTELRALGPLEA